jgi:tetratricopeptide (TPR) repeat protein
MKHGLTAATTRTSKAVWDVFADTIPQNSTVCMDCKNTSRHRNGGKRRIFMGTKEVYEQILTDAMQNDPDSAFAYYGRGEEYSRNGDFDRAIGEYDAAIKIDANYANAYDSRGCTYASKGDHDRAIADFTEAIRINPKESFYYRHRGDTYSDKKNYDKAIADFTEAVNLELNEAKELTDHGPFKAGWAKTYHSRAMAYIEKKNYKQAVADLEKAVELAPDEELLRDKLAIVKKRAGSGKSKWIWRGIRAGIGIIIGLILNASVSWGTVAGWVVFGALAGIFIRPIWYFIIALIKKD